MKSYWRQGIYPDTVKVTYDSNKVTIHLTIHIDKSLGLYITQHDSIQLAYTKASNLTVQLFQAIWKIIWSSLGKKKNLKLIYLGPANVLRYA